jgi:hypothetical protein
MESHDIEEATTEGDTASWDLMTTKGARENLLSKPGPIA